MPLIRYETKRFERKTLEIIGAVNTILADFRRQGYDMTLRQVYYQMIAKDLFPDTWIDRAYNQRNGLDPETKNTIKNYKNLGTIIGNARRAGMIDWDSIVDRTRNLKGNSHWDSPASIIRGAARGFRYDLWENQPHRVEVWVEKEALVGVIERACIGLDIDFFACKGYASDPELWAAGQRLKSYRDRGQEPIVLHFGDHDPSGIDMTRDIIDRLLMFSEDTIEVRRLALTMDQIEEFNPPPNPAKESDSRIAGYRAMYGDDSWELDALTPTVIGDLIRQEVASIVDEEEWDAAVVRQDEAREELKGISDKYPRVVQVLPTIDSRLLVRPCRKHFTAAAVQDADFNWRCDVCRGPLSVVPLDG